MNHELQSMKPFERKLFWLSVIFTFILLGLGVWKAAELAASLFAALLGGP